jgi:hypothetical protein
LRRSRKKCAKKPEKVDAFTLPAAGDIFSLSEIIVMFEDVPGFQFWNRYLEFEAIRCQM